MPRGDLCAASMVCEVHKPEKLDSTDKGPTRHQKIQVAGRVRPRHLILLPCLLRKIAANLVAKACCSECVIFASSDLSLLALDEIFVEVLKA